MTRIVCATLAIVLLAHHALAQGKAFHFQREQNIDVNQVGSVRIDIAPDGRGLLRDFWSNGKKVAGNTFYAVVVLADKQGKPIWSNKQTKGLDGSFGGRA